MGTVREKNCERCGCRFAYHGPRGRPRKYCAVCYVDLVEAGELFDSRDPLKRSYMREYMKGYRNRRCDELALTQGEREELKARAGKCACCGSTERLQVHHCHETGFVDGVDSVLCGACNGSAGQVGDDPDRLEQIAAYMRRFRTRAHKAA